MGTNKKESTNMNEEPRKLKRVVIKEEMVALTGKVNHAIVLNQMIYWSERVKDAKKFVEEEKKRAREFMDGSIESEEDIVKNLESGWIYKSADEMISDTMLTISNKTMTRIFDDLVENGWLSRRRNPKYDWDKTWQYRVNLNKIQQDLMALGYALEGYTMPENNEVAATEEADDKSNRQNDNSEGQNDNSNRQNDKSVGQNDESNGQSDKSNRQNEQSNGQNNNSSRQNDEAIPKITTENTSESTSDITNLSSENLNTYNTDNTKEPLENIYPQFSEEEKKRLQQQYLEKAFYENIERIPEELAKVLQVFSSSIEEAKEYYNVILTAKKKVEIEADDIIWWEHDPDMLNKTVNTFIRCVRKLKQSGSDDNAEGYLYTAMHKHFTDEILDRRQSMIDKKVFENSPYNIFRKEQ